LGELHPRIAGRVLSVEAGEVEEEAQRDQVLPHRARLVPLGKVGHPGGHLVGGQAPRVAVAEELACLPECGAVVPDRALVKIEAGGKEALRPAPDGENGAGRFGQSLQGLDRVAAGGEFASDQVAASAGLLHAAERAAVLDRIRAATKPVAHDEPSAA
jgi:hypothetical protein